MEITAGPQASSVPTSMTCRARKPSTLEACGPAVISICSVISLHFITHKIRCSKKKLKTTRLTCLLNPTSDLLILRASRRESHEPELHTITHFVHFSLLRDDPFSLINRKPIRIFVFCAGSELRLTGSQSDLGEGSQVRVVERVDCQDLRPTHQSDPPGIAPFSLNEANR